MKSLKKLGFVAVGMTIADLNGVQLTISDIIIPSKDENVFVSKIPKGNDLVVQFDNGQYLYTTIGWENLDGRIQVLNEDKMMKKYVLS